MHIKFNRWNVCVYLLSSIRTVWLNWLMTTSNNRNIRKMRSFYLNVPLAFVIKIDKSDVLVCGSKTCQRCDTGPFEWAFYRYTKLCCKCSNLHHLPLNWEQRYPINIRNCIWLTYQTGGRVPLVTLAWDFQFRKIEMFQSTTDFALHSERKKENKKWHTAKWI